jgi:spoIIIJ-associated protein
MIFVDTNDLKLFEIKASSQDDALNQIKDVHNLSEDDYRFEINLLKEPKKLLGLIQLKGLYEITAIPEKKVENLVVESAKKLLKLMDINLEVEVVKSSDHFALLNLAGPDKGIIIGKKGKTLNSFEFLLNTLVKGCRVEVDVEGFKEKRANTLRDLARKMAEKALRTDKAVKLNAMPPRERKIIHEIINKFEDLDTYSEGKDPKRYIVIRKKKVG